MVPYSVIQKSQFEGVLWIDGGYYQQKIADLVEKSHEAHKKLEEAKKIRTPVVGPPKAAHYGAGPSSRAKLATG